MVMAIPKKLVVLGDSGVQGWGDPLEGGWCERLRRHWMELPNGPVVYNLGVRGDGLERLSSRLKKEKQERNRAYARKFKKRKLRNDGRGEGAGNGVTGTANNGGAAD